MAGEATRGDRTRDALLVAARTRFEEAGFDGTTLASIAADAGVAQATVVFHFGSKAGLLVAVMRGYYDELLSAMDAVLDPALEPVERLGTFARWWLDRTAAHYELLSVFGRHGRRTEPDEIVGAFREENRRVTTRFDALVEDLKHAGRVAPDVPTRILRDAFFGTTEHLLVGRVLTGRPEDLAPAADDLVQLLLHGSAGTAAAAPTVEARLRALENKLDTVAARLR